MSNHGHNKHNENLTLSQLQGNAQHEKEGFQEVSVSEIAATLPKQPVDPKEVMGSAITGDLGSSFDNLLNRVNTEATEYLDENEDTIIEEMEAEQVQSKNTSNLIEDEEDEDFIDTTSTIEEKKMVFDDEDELDIIKAEEDEDNDEEKIRKQIISKVRGVKPVIDLSKFTISKTPVSASTALDSATTEETFTWGLSSSESSITLRQFKGDDIDTLRERESENRFAEARRVWKNIYDHIADPVVNFEKWLKSIRFFDQEDLFFAIYKATYSGANFLPYKCEECGEAFVSDNIPMQKMVKFPSAEIEAKMKDLVTAGSPIPKEVEVKLEVINDKYVVGIKSPSVFDVLFQFAVLDDKFTNQYGELLSLVSFIDSIYVIDMETQTLKPIEFKEYPDNLAKTVKSKIRRISKFKSNLNADEYNYLSDTINEYGNGLTNPIEYIIPSIECPKCAKEIEEAVVSTRVLLFTRHQLTGPKLG